jgi:hypothetical protein
MEKVNGSTNLLVLEEITKSELTVIVHHPSHIPSQPPLPAHPIVQLPQWELLQLMLEVLKFINGILKVNSVV